MSLSHAMLTQKPPTPSPSRLLFAHRSNSHDRVARHFYELSYPVYLLFMRNPSNFPPCLFLFYKQPPNFPPMFVSSLLMGRVPFDSIQALPSISSLHMNQVPPNPILDPLLSPLYAQVEFPLTWFLVPQPNYCPPFVSSLRTNWVPLNPILGPPSISFPCTGRVPSNLIPVHLSMLQVHGSQLEVLMHAWMSYKYGRAQF